MTTNPTSTEKPNTETLLHRIIVAVEKDRGRGKLELAVAIILSLATLASTWCGYQASEWGGLRSTEQAAADTAERQAAEDTIVGLQRPEYVLTEEVNAKRLRFAGRRITYGGAEGRGRLQPLRLANTDVCLGAVFWRHHGDVYRATCASRSGGNCVAVVPCHCDNADWIASLYGLKCAFESSALNELRDRTVSCRHRPCSACSGVERIQGIRDHLIPIQIPADSNANFEIERDPA